MTTKMMKGQLSIVVKMNVELIYPEDTEPGTDDVYDAIVEQLPPGMEFEMLSHDDWLGNGDWIDWVPDEE